MRRRSPPPALSDRTRGAGERRWAPVGGGLVRPIREPSGPLTFTMLGQFSVTRGGRRVPAAAWERRVAERLVRFLLVRRGGVVCEDELFDAFWPGRVAESARPSLRVAVSRARSVLDGPRVESVIAITERTYRLRLRPGDSVDADEFESAAIAAFATHGERRMRLLERAARRWAGEPLPEERYSDWARGWRARLVDVYAALLAALADGCFEGGDVIGAGLRARELVLLDPLNEGGHRRLMLAYARGGQRGRALRQFLECHRALHDDLGVAPSVDTVRLRERIVSGEPV